MRQCSRCASELNEKDKVCPRCGLPVEKMQESEETLSEKMMKESSGKKNFLVRKEFSNSYSFSNSLFFKVITTKEKK